MSEILSEAQKYVLTLITRRIYNTHTIQQVLEMPRTSKFP